MLGNLAQKFNVIEKDILEAYLSKVIIKSRGKAHDKDESGEFTSFEVETCEICLSFLLRSLYRAA